MLEYGGGRMRFDSVASKLTFFWFSSITSFLFYFDSQAGRSSTFERALNICTLCCNIAASDVGPIASDIDVLYMWLIM